MFNTFQKCIYNTFIKHLNPYLGQLERKSSFQREERNEEGESSEKGG